MDNKQIQGTPELPDKWWIGVPFYFRNNSTNKPTLRHIMNDGTEKAYCGFNDFYAQVVPGDTSDYSMPTDMCCKKCLYHHFVGNSYHKTEHHTITRDVFFDERYRQLFFMHKEQSVVIAQFNGYGTAYQHEAIPNGKLCAEAFQVRKESGKGPKELWEENKEKQIEIESLRNNVNLMATGHERLSQLIKKSEEEKAALSERVKELESLVQELETERQRLTK